MALFRYQAVNRSGKTVRGQMEAADPAAVTAHLRRRGLYPVRVEPAAQQHVRTGRGFRLGSRVRIQDLAVFCRQFATLVRAGVPAARSLAILAAQTEHRVLKGALVEIEDEVRRGNSLHQAFGHQSRVFPPLFIHMVGAGEASGQLDVMLDRLASFYERERATSQKIVSALTYPLVVLVVAIAVSVFLLVSVVPTFAQTFAQQGVALPLPTRITLGVSHFLVERWYLILGLAAGAAAGWWAIGRTPKGRRWQCRLAFAWPIFGKLNRKNAVARFSRTLATLVRSAVPILEALELTKKVIGNALFEDALTEAQESLRAGETMGAALGRHGNLLPPLVTQMIAVGEETGTLDEMLDKLADFYDADVQEMSARLSTLLEPVLILFLAVLVGLIILSVYLPMFQMMNFVG
ncbi:MAG: type II secretion system F family protein [Alicyclobacillaceae bacterium]|nr:type II secretion system F family protein [Alicyclobacillaceae bacterium]